MKYKALFLDIDDTLVSKVHGISVGNKRAISAAIDAGVYVSLATGRGPLGAAGIVDEAGIKVPIIAYGGAMVADPVTGEQLFCAYIEPELITEALQLAHELGLHVQLYQNDTVIFERENEFTRRYTGAMYLPFKVDPDIRLKSWKSPKVLAFALPEQEADALERFNERFSQRLEIASSKPGFVEINKFGCNKGVTMEWLCNRLGISMSECIAVGDNTLDIEMIKMAGLGVCVGDGQQVVKDAADVIAPACDDDAVKWVIERYIL